MGFPQLCNRYGNHIAEFQIGTGRLADPGHEDPGILGAGEDGVNVIRPDGHHVAPLVLAEEDGEGRMARKRVDDGADARGDRHLGQGHGEPAVGAVMDGGGEAVADQAADEIADAFLMGQVDGRRRAVFASENLAEIHRLAEMRAPAGWRAGEEDRLAFEP